MKLFVCAVFDSKAEAFNQPYFSATRGLAERMFSDALNSDDSNNVLVKHPEDFSLYLLGEYDDSSGGLTPVVPPQMLASAVNLINS